MAMLAVRLLSRLRVRAARSMLPIMRKRLLRRLDRVRPDRKNVWAFLAIQKLASSTLRNLRKDYVDSRAV